MLLKLDQKTIQIPINKEIFVYCSSKIRVITLSTSLNDQYLILPDYVIINQSESLLILSVDGQIDCSLKIKFEEDVLSWVKSSSKLFRNKLILKGLGCKASLSNNQTILNLKLGYSHVLNVSIPTGRIKIRLCKNTITVQGHNSSEVGDFARRIRGLRYPDPYKGKGIWLKNEHRILKELKKK
jgi:ribosomal protein L6P/L9E